VDKNGYLVCSRGTRSRLLPFAGALGFGNAVECMWAASAGDRTVGTLLAGVIFSLCGMWPLKAIKSMPRARLTQDADSWPLAITMGSFALFFICFYSLCGVVPFTCFPYVAPWPAIVGAYVGGAMVGSLLGIYTGAEFDENDFMPPFDVGGGPLWSGSTVVEMLPVVKHADLRTMLACEEMMRECTICYEGLISTTDEELCVVKTPCDHLYHKHCLASWLQSHRSCPICRTDLVDAVVGGEQPQAVTIHVSTNGTGNTEQATEPQASDANVSTENADGAMAADTMVATTGVRPNASASPPPPPPPLPPPPPPPPPV